MQKTYVENAHFCAEGGLHQELACELTRKATAEYVLPSTPCYPIYSILSRCCIFPPESPVVLIYLALHVEERNDVGKTFSLDRV